MEQEEGASNVGLQQLQVKMMLEKSCMIMPVLVFLPLKRTKAVMKLMVVLMSQYSNKLHII